MRRVLHAAALARALMLGAVPCLLAVAPAHAQIDQSVSFDSFHSQLAPYGAWLYSDRWGLVWQPTDVPDDFRPYYSDGHWVDTDDYGWMWVSDYEWGDIVFHYGRWVNDPEDGWLWIPGYTWGPAWVVWRSDDEFIGWMPMPPDDAFLEDGGAVSAGLTFGGDGSISFVWNDPYFGYRHWYGNDYDDRRFAANWVFIGAGHMGEGRYSRFAVHDPNRITTIFRQTRNVTNYTVVNNYVVNRSVNVHLVERASGHPIQLVRARSVMRKPNLIGTVEMGRHAREHSRATVPVGRGIPNSAPPPPRAVIENLSERSAHRRGREPVNLFNRSTVTTPQALSRFHGGAPATRAEPAPPPVTRTMPNAQPMRQPNIAAPPPHVPPPVTKTMPNAEPMRRSNIPNLSPRAAPPVPPKVLERPATGDTGAGVSSHGRMEHVPEPRGTMENRAAPTAPVVHPVPQLEPRRYEGPPAAKVRTQEPPRVVHPEPAVPSGARSEPPPYMRPSQPNQPVSPPVMRRPETPPPNVERGMTRIQPPPPATTSGQPAGNKEEKRRGEREIPPKGEPPH